MDIEFIEDNIKRYKNDINNLITHASQNPLPYETVVEKITRQIPFRDNEFKIKIPDCFIAKYMHELSDLNYKCRHLEISITNPDPESILIIAYEFGFRMDLYDFMISKRTSNPDFIVIHIIESVDEKLDSIAAKKYRKRIKETKRIPEYKLDPYGKFISGDYDAYTEMITSCTLRAHKREDMEYSIMEMLKYIDTLDYLSQELEKEHV